MIAVLEAGGAFTLSLHISLTVRHARHSRVRSRSASAWALDASSDIVKDLKKYR